MCEVEKDKLIYQQAFLKLFRDCPNVYRVVVDGWFKEGFFAENDEEAIEYVKKRSY